MASPRIPRREACPGALPVAIGPGFDVSRRRPSVAGAALTSVPIAPATPRPDQVVVPALLVGDKGGVEGRHHAPVIKENRQVVALARLGLLAPGRSSLDAGRRRRGGSGRRRCCAWPGTIRTSVARTVRKAISPVNSSPLALKMPMTLMVVISRSRFSPRPSRPPWRSRCRGRSTPHPPGSQHGGGRRRPGFLPREECGQRRRRRRPAGDRGGAERRSRQPVEGGRSGAGISNDEGILVRVDQPSTPGSVMPFRRSSSFTSALLSSDSPMDRSTASVFENCTSA